eukprot:CAMPEP_0184868172 /NCGR_PEP_ID=MMETSP0580-20130426/29467_1 /TAXON_ID=1118495 /ORGANISM="Dactyliosolen fragilissimus" /LENGTH=320 /DNA_ID=CAMNT_0027368901 /DNA_START=361 /DNA_END=1320 /DNA_ORIENTATION=-
MYNGNYIRSYERAFYQIGTSRQFGDKDKTQQNNCNVNPAGKHVGILDYHDWFISSITKHKFKSSPPLGGKFKIRGKRLVSSDKSSQTEKETWEMEMFGETFDDENLVSDTVVYNTAIVTIARKISTPPELKGTKEHDENNEADLESPSHTTKIQKNSLTKSFEHVFETYRDEFDVCETNTPKEGRFPLRSVLNLFERSRSLGLGGPDELRKMKEEEGILWVVTSIDNLKLIPIDGKSNLNKNMTEQQEYGICKIGGDLAVKSTVTMKRRGMILEFNQILMKTSKIENEDSHQIIAKGDITICAVDVQTGRPTRKIPSSLR